ncbi:hypothetical protein DYB38_004428, partial [Aphanomyces astaci]
LRLWGARGQEKLMSTKLLLLNAGPTGSEILKNVVLPGVGSFEICDDHIVSESDLGNNFFVTADDLNRPRAQVVTEWMLEMNSDVTGTFLVKRPSDVIAKDISYVNGFNLVVATQLVEPSLSALAKHCQEHAIPLLVLHSFGLFGYLRLQIPDHTIIDSKPDTPFHDLRLASPFPELQVYIYISIYSNFGEKDAFKQCIRSKCHGSFGQQLNFQEAFDNAFKAYSLPKDAIPDEVTSVLQYASSLAVTPTTPSFWVLARAVAEFVISHDSLPLSGHVPDMTAFTHTYIALQQIYVRQAAADCDEVLATVEMLLTTAGGDPKR